MLKHLVLALIEYATHIRTREEIEANLGRSINSEEWSDWQEGIYRIRKALGNRKMDWVD